MEKKYLKVYRWRPFINRKNQEVKIKKIKSNYYCKKYNCSVNIKMILKIKIILNDFIIKWAMEIIKIH